MLTKQLVGFSDNFPISPNKKFVISFYIQKEYICFLHNLVDCQESGIQIPGSQLLGTSPVSETLYILSKIPPDGSVYLSVSERN